MGRRHREKRATVKAALRKEGWYENEFGELKRRMTKTQAREALLAVRRHRIESIYDLVKIIEKKAIEELQAAEDARVFALLDEAGIPPLPAP